MKTRPFPTVAVAFAVGLSLGLVAAQSDPSPAEPPTPVPIEETLSIEPCPGVVSGSRTSLLKPIAYRVGDSTHKITNKSGESAKVLIVPFRVNKTRVLLAYEITSNQ